MYYGGTIGVNILKYVVSILQGINYVNQNQDAFETLMQVDLLRSGLIAVVFAPIVEECLMRGLIFRPLWQRSRVLAYALSMLVFSFLHVLSSLLNGGTQLAEVLWNIATYLPAGFALAWVYERTKTIWASIFLHTVVNFISILMISLLSFLAERFASF